MTSRIVASRTIVAHRVAPQRVLEANLQFVASEMASGEPGFETIVSRLADILVVQAVRAHLAQTGGGCKGWLGR